MADILQFHRGNGKAVRNSERLIAELHSPVVKPYEFQERGRDMIVKNGATYLMWDMGKGKTLTCILAMKKLGIPVLVLSIVNSATITWPDELDKWAPDITYTVLHGPNKEHYASQAHNSDVVIMNFDGLPWWYEMVRRGTFKLRKFFVIWDESSALKDHTTKRWQIMADAMPIYSPYRVCLSGTPMPNGLVDLWSQYYLLDKGKRLSPSFHQFRNKFFNYSGSPRYITTLKPTAEEIIYDRIADITDRLGPEDGDELPKQNNVKVKLRMPPKIRKLYNEYEKEFMLEFPEGFSTANSSAVLKSKLRQFSQGAVYIDHEEGVPRGTHKDWKLIHDIKALAVRDIVNVATSPMLVPIQFKFEKAILEKALKRKLPSIDGRTPALEAKRLVKAWNNRELPVLLCHPRSVAFSLNLQYGGHTILWVALPWELDLWEQLPRRLRRRGQEAESVTNLMLTFEDSVDEDVFDSLTVKNYNQEHMFAGIMKRQGGKYGCR